MKIKLSTFRLIIYLLLVVLFFFIIAIPALKGNIHFKFYFDTDVYEKIYESGQFTLMDIIKDDFNYLGPFLIQYLVSPNRFVIFLLNIIIFIASYRLFVKSYSINRNLLLFFIFISPYFFVSLLSLNKEIISILALACFFAYFGSKKNKYLIFALLLSVLVRWQFTFFILLFVFLESNLNPLYKKRFLSFLVLIALISFTYTVITSGWLKVVRSAASSHFLLYGSEGKGTFQMMTAFQEKGGYFLVFIPKAFHLLFGYFSKIQQIFEGNYIIHIGQSLASLLLLFYLFYKYLRQRLEVNNNLFYMAMIYCLVFTITPIHVPRYLFPFYIILSLLVSVRKQEASPAESIERQDDRKEQ